MGVTKAYLEATVKAAYVQGQLSTKASPLFDLQKNIRYTASTILNSILPAFGGPFDYQRMVRNALDVRNRIRGHYTALASLERNMPEAAGSGILNRLKATLVLSNGLGKALGQASTGNALGVGRLHDKFNYLMMELLDIAEQLKVYIQRSAQARRKV